MVEIVALSKNVVGEAAGGLRGAVALTGTVQVGCRGHQCGSNLGNGSSHGLRVKHRRLVAGSLAGACTLGRGWLGNGAIGKGEVGTSTRGSKHTKE